MTPGSVALDGLHGALARGPAVLTATRRLARALRLGDARGTGTERAGARPTCALVRVAEASFPRAAGFRRARRSAVLLDELAGRAVGAGCSPRIRCRRQLLMPGGAVEGFREAWRWRTSGACPGRCLRGAGRRGLPGLPARGGGVSAPTRGARLPRCGPAAGAARAGADRGGGSGRAVRRLRSLASGAAGRLIGRSARARAAVAPPARAVPTLAAFPTARTRTGERPRPGRARGSTRIPPRASASWCRTSRPAPCSRTCWTRRWRRSGCCPARRCTEPWNLSLGQPLADAPVVAAAFLAFGLLRERARDAASSRLLRSPFIGGAATRAPSARASRPGSRHAGDRIARARCSAGWAARSARRPVPRWRRAPAGLLDELRAGSRAAAGRRPGPAACTRGLTRLGWPGDDPWTARPGRPCRPGRSCWRRSRGSTPWSARSRLADALARLRRLAAEQRFQPETPEVPVQVLGLLETAGLEFDGLWVTGMHDGALPQPLRPCPLLPAALQRERQMPRACPDTELALARRARGAARRRRAGGRFSYPERARRAAAPEPGRGALPRADSGTSFTCRDVAAAGFAARRLESLADAGAPPIAGDVRGGTACSSAQSACPFMAFASTGSARRPLETPAAGIDGRARGLFVHLALASCGARSGPRGPRGARCCRTRRAGARGARARRGAGTSPGAAGLVQIELDEAARRIGELLRVEVARPAFEVVQREQPVRSSSARCASMAGWTASTASPAGG
jgi:ATP-dependent helicase/nuclease subunit B